MYQKWNEQTVHWQHYETWGTKKKKNLTSKFYGFSTICKHVSFSKTTIHQALPISVSSFKNVACFCPSLTVVILVNKQEKKQQQNFCQIKNLL